MIYAHQPIHTSHGNSVNVRVAVNGYEISIALDDSCGVITKLGRSSICIFHGDDRGEDVTNTLMGTNEILWADGDDLMKAMKACMEAPPGRGIPATR